MVFVCCGLTAFNHKLNDSALGVNELWFLNGCFVKEFRLFAHTIKGALRKYVLHRGILVSMVVLLKGNCLKVGCDIAKLGL